MVAIRGIMRWVWRRWWDVRCGRHSGFPRCCVLWYVTVWQFVLLDRSEGFIYRYRYLRVFGRDVEYVRCPMCYLRRRAVAMQVCDCKAVEWQGRRFR